MKKSLFLAALSLLACSPARAAWLLTVTDGTYAATNLRNYAGQSDQRLIWGIVIDTAGDGFQFGNYAGSNVLSPSTGPQMVPVSNNPLTSWPSPNPTAPSGQFLSTLDVGGAATLSDDLLLICNTPMSVAGSQDGSLGFARPMSLAGLPTGVNGIGAGDPFALIWFDTTAFTASRVQEGQYYGYLTHEGLSGAAFTVPSDGLSYSVTNNFVGADPARPANTSWLGVVPEPAAWLLGLVGLVPLMARRRV